jgi:tetratricopeptide (TPR) repeat protein
MPSHTEMGQRLISGDITPAQFLGISQEQLYEIATLGHNMMSQGQLQQAMDIFKGLVAASPYDSVFHCNLAAVHAQEQRYAEAMEEYTQALELNLANVDALVGRSELYLREGKVAEALADIKAALELDPQAQQETAQRARATLMVLQKMAEDEELAQAAKP